MIEVHKTTARGKGHNTDEKFFYINLMGFRDEAHQDVIYKKILDLIKDHETKLRVF